MDLNLLLCRAMLGATNIIKLRTIPGSGNRSDNLLESRDHHHPLHRNKKILNSITHATQGTLYTTHRVHCTQHTGYTVQNTQGTLYTAHRVHCTQHTGYTVHNTQGTMYTAHRVHCTQHTGYTEHSTQGTLYTTHRVHCTQHKGYTAQGTWYTAHRVQ